MNTTTKPSALIGFPGDTPPVFDLSAAGFAANNKGFDLFVQGINPNSYIHSGTGSSSFRFFWATASNRMTFDNDVWSNSGYGASAGSNATMFFIDGAGGTAMQYVFLNNCSETNRQSGNAGNNFAGCSFYTVSDSLVQGCSIVQPTLVIDEAWQPKSDVSNSSWRGNTTIVASVQYAYSPLQAIVPSFNNFEVCYSIIMGGGSITFPIGTFPYGTMWCYRNSVQGTNGVVCGQPGSDGPYVFDSNAVQGGGLPVGASVQTDGLNLIESSGLLTSTGALTPAFSTSIGKVGAQIA
jgi:hypothetical protein